MCGIAGALSLRSDLAPPDLDLISRMVGALRHRGPDEFGLYRDARIGLGHARLSIIDLESGQQPLSNETNSLWITFNGEIFNYIELRAELEDAGHVFRTRSDTEVIVHAFEQWGADAFSRCNGQWAVALWDATTGTLVLARDPFGVRPLFICEHNQRLYFASEVKAIFAADASIPRRFDPVSLAQTFTFWSTIAPSSGFEGVREIEPGTVVTIKDRSVRRSRCYTPGFPEGDDYRCPLSLAEAAEAVRDALQQSTSLRMLRADVPVGCYLSGGLDSSITATLGRLAKGANFSTFSLRFTDPEYDETPYQQLMAAYLGSEHHDVVVSAADIARVFPTVIQHTERPILRTAPAPLFLLSQRVKDAGIKVVLTGEGADEMFAGYDLFREAKIRRFWARAPASAIRPRLLERLYPYLQRSPVHQAAIARQFFGQDLESYREPGFGHSARWRTTSTLARLFTDDFRRALTGRDVREDLIATLPGAFPGWSSLAQDQYIEVRTLLSGYLLSSQGDRMLMAHSVEGRFPFLDRNVAALAESLPASYKLRVLDEKHVLKRAAGNLLPQEILRRPKQPYRAPDALAFVSARPEEWIGEVTDPRHIEAAGVFVPSAVQRLLDKSQRPGRSGQFSNADNMALVGILSTQLVYEQFIKNRPAATAIRPRTIVDRVVAPTESPV